MADTALADMTDGSTAQATDIIYAVRDPSGTPLNRKLTIANVRAYLLAQANTWTAAQTFSNGIVVSEIVGTVNAFEIKGATGFGSVHFCGYNASISDSVGITIRNSSMLGWANSGISSGATIDAILKRAAAAVISLEGVSSVGGTLRSVPQRATQITADQNNYAPGGTSLLQFWSSDAARSVTGLSLSQVDGQQHEVWNIGSNNIVLVHQSASSTAANRFLTTTGADLTLSAGQMAFLRYDNTQSRWLAVKGT